MGRRPLGSTGPRRVVVHGELVEETGSARMRRRWHLTLDCGHLVRRKVDYVTRAGLNPASRRQRLVTDVLPHGGTSYCDVCLHGDLA